MSVIVNYIFKAYLLVCIMINRKKCVLTLSRHVEVMLFCVPVML